MEVLKFFLKSLLDSSSDHTVEEATVIYQTHTLNGIRHQIGALCYNAITFLF